MSELVTKKKTFPSAGVWALVGALLVMTVIWMIMQDSMMGDEVDTTIPAVDNTGLPIAP